jgi:hypothetical protein
MKKVIVYVEGLSDKLAMQALLDGLLARLQQAGVAVQFVESQNKEHLLLKTPIKAANILLNDPAAVVIALPDLYPRNQGFPHSSFSDLQKGLRNDFERAAQRKGSDEHIARRFLIFCFKHDLEALLLAAEAQLAGRLGVDEITRSWKIPVEDQDHDKPPKRVIEELFEKQHQRYKDTVDAPLILGAASYATIAERCPQCFKPFVAYLESLLSGGAA